MRVDKDGIEFFKTLYTPSTKIFIQPSLLYNNHRVTNFQMKSEFVYVKPKTPEASEYFEHEMRSLHSCKVKEKRNGKLLLASISGNYNFWVSESEDRHWKLLNSN